MGEESLGRSFVRSLSGAGLVAAALSCGGSSNTLLSSDSSVSDVSTPESSGPIPEGSGSSSGSSGGFSGDTAAPPLSDAGDASMGEAGDAGGMVVGTEGGDARDSAPPDGNASACATICAGCCDSSGICRGGNSTTVCGMNGASCADCLQRTTCPISTAGCCTPAGKCGCAVGGLVGCN